MDKIKSILAQIDDPANTPAVRLQILALLDQSLRELNQPLDDWQKTHFSNAIGALGLNIHSATQPTSSWLRLCLIDLEKALAPADPGYRSPDPSLRDVTQEQLLGAVLSLTREVRYASQ